jgi:uncharacterized membrane protein (DUF485 family)
MSNSSTPTRRFNAVLGLVLFAIYLLIYVGFVVTSAFMAQTMDRVVWNGLNLAVVYGFALIIIAFVMAMIYGLMCRAEVGGPTSEDVSRSNSRAKETV